MSASRRVVFDPRFDLDRDRAILEQVALDAGKDWFDSLFRPGPEPGEAMLPGELGSASDCLAESCLICGRGLAANERVVNFNDEISGGNIGAVCLDCLKLDRADIMSRCDEDQQKGIYRTIGRRVVESEGEGETLDDRRKSMDSLEACMICERGLVPGAAAVLFSNAKTDESIGAVCLACTQSNWPGFVKTHDAIVGDREAEYYWFRYPGAEPFDDVAASTLEEDGPEGGLDEDDIPEVESMECAEWQARLKSLAP